MVELSGSRVVRIQGPARGGHRLWEGTFDLAYAPFPSEGEGKSGLARNAAIRVLLQDAEPANLLPPFPIELGKKPPPEGPVKFHDPRLLAAAVKADNENAEGGTSLVAIAGSQTRGPTDAKGNYEPRGQVLPLDADLTHPGPDGARMNVRVSFADVLLVPDFVEDRRPGQADWPKKEDAEIELPPLRLVGGTIPCGIRQKSSAGIERRLDISWKEDRALLFGGLCFARLRKVPGRDIAFVPIVLTPEGVEFEAGIARCRAMPNGDADVTELLLRLRLEFDGSKGYRLVPLGPAVGEGTSWHDLRARFDGLMARLAPKGARLFLDAAPGTPPLAWPLADNGKTLTGEGLPASGRSESFIADLDPTRLRAGLRSDPAPGGVTAAVASLRLDAARLTQTQGETAVSFTFRGGEAPAQGAPLLARPSLGLSWRATLGEITAVLAETAPAADGAPGAPWSAGAPVDGVAATAEIEARLRVQYAAAGVLPADPAAPLYAFLPLERGALQLQVPAAKNAPAVAAPVASASAPAFGGLVRASLGGAALPAPVAEGGAGGGVSAPASPPERDRRPCSVELVRAERSFARVTLDGDGFSAALLLWDVEGRLDGALWRAAASPTAEEILPTLAAGPMALASVPIRIPTRIGGIAVPGWPVTVDPGDVAITLASPQDGEAGPGAVAWLPAHERLAAVAAMPMTRSALSSSAPSLSRDLLPWGAGGRNLRMVPGRLLPTLAPIPRVQPPGMVWPWPGAAGTGPEEPEDPAVPFALVTLPGVEIAPGTKDEGLRASLRYDLPILGELHAGAVPKTSALAPAAQADHVPPEGEAPPAPAVTALDPRALGAIWQGAADRLALTRTMLDRATDWGAPGRARILIDTLVEPYVWETTFTVTEDEPTEDGSGLPLGAYALGDAPVSGPEALSGLTARFSVAGRSLTRITDGRPPAPADIEIVGFAARMEPSAGLVFDTRGAGLAVEPGLGPDGGGWSVREARLLGRAGVADDAFRLMTRRTPIPLRLPGAEAFLTVRDLPMTETAAPLPTDQRRGLVFEGGRRSDDLPALFRSGPEDGLGPSGDVFRRDHLPFATYEWRFFAPGTPPCHSIDLGPFRFRALRLWRLETDAEGRTERAVVIGTIGSPGNLPAPAEGKGAIPVDEQAYRSDNLAALRFARQGDGTLALAGLSSVAVDDLSVVVGDEAAGVALRFEDVAAAPFAPVADLPFALSLRLVLAGDALMARDIALRTRLFGRPLSLKAADAALTTTLDFAFDDPAESAAGARLSVRQVRLAWKRSESAVVSCTAKARIEVQGCPGVAWLDYDLSGPLAWLDANVAIGKAEVDHTLGTIRAKIAAAAEPGAPDAAAGEEDAPAPAPAATDVEMPGQRLLRGLAFPQGRLAGALALAVSDRPDDGPGWPLAAGLVELAWTVDGVDRVRQQILGRSLARPEDSPACEWTSTLLLRLGPRPFNSAISWPKLELPTTGGATRPVREGDPYAPDPKRAVDWRTAITLRADTRRAHKVSLELDDLLLPADRVGPADDAVDEQPGLAIVRPWRFRALAKHSLESAAAGGPALTWNAVEEVALVDLPALAAAEAESEAYAFAARYIDGLGREVKSPGIVRRAFAQAGFPPRQVVRALARARTAGEAIASTLLITGAAVIEVALPTDRRRGVTLVLPWFSGFDDVPPSPIAAIPQAPRATTAARADLMAGRAHPRATAVATTLGRRGGSVLALRAALAAAFGEGALRAATPVDQAFSAATDEDGPGWNEAPIFIRALAALTTIAGAVGDGNGPVALAADTIIATATRPGRAGAVRVDLADTTAPTPPRGEVELLVLTRDDLRRVPLGAAGEVPLQGEELGAIAARAFAVAPRPLALLLAEVDDPRPRVPEETPLHRGLRQVALPAALAPPPEGRALRNPTTTLFASPRLGWPAENPSGDLMLRLGDERPIQDRDAGWAGRARALSGPVEAAGGQATGSQAPEALAFLALGRKTLFRRTGDALRFRAPPDLALAPFSPRPRAPLAERIEAALRANRSEGEDRPLGTLLPGPVEILSTGVRPGTLGFEHDGYIAGSDGTAFDAEHPRFGRLAHRGPTLWRQVRAPRSGPLPAARRTFVADNETQPDIAGGGGARRPFALMHGPAVVIRAEAAQLGKGGGGLVAIRLILEAPAGGIGPDWDGAILMRAVEGGAPAAPALLARIGLLREKASIAVEFDRDRLPFGTIAYQKDGRLRLAPGENRDALRSFRAALTEASADVPLALVFDLAPADPGEAAPVAPVDPALEAPGAPVPLTSARSPLITDGGSANPPRSLRLPLPRTPAFGPRAPVDILTLAFGDPDYDSRLASAAQKATRIGKAAPTPGGGAVEGEIALVFAVDRSEYDREETIHFAVGKAAQDGGIAVAGVWKLTVSVQPRVASQPLRRLGIRGAEPDEAKKTAEETAKETDRPFSIASGVAQALPVSTLTEDGSAEAARLEPGDLLILNAWPDDPDTSILRQELRLTAEPVVAPAEAVYAAVTLDAAPSQMPMQRATPVLFATAPRATAIEFPDLLGDLGRGHVRRRGLFIWRFSPRGACAPPHTVSVAVIKYDRSGGAQLPVNIGDFYED